jgi:hypothetical protein
MIALSPLFEIKIPFSDNLAEILKNPKVQEFIHLSKKLVDSGEEALTSQQQTKYRGMFEDEAVKDYITATAKTGERDGWIRGGILGFLTGSTVSLSAFANDIGGLPLAALTLLGGIAGGFIVGYPVSKLLSILRKWRAEDNVVKLAKVGGSIGKTVPFVTTNSNISTF